MECAVELGSPLKILPEVWLIHSLVRCQVIEVYHHNSGPFRQLRLVNYLPSSF